jgi:hypothetical protein
MHSGLPPAVFSTQPFPQGFSAEFFKQQPQRAAVATAEGISFSVEEDKSISQFQQSPRFVTFKQQFLAHIECIAQFAREHLDDAAHEACRALHLFANNVFDIDAAYFAGEESILYGEGKRSLEQFCAQLADAGIDLAQRRNCVLQLAEGIQECGADAAVNLAQATRSLQEMKGGQFLRLKNEVAMALITEAYRQLTTEGKPVGFTIHLAGKTIDRIPASYEIHFATSLYNALAESLGLEKHVDPVAERCGFSSEAVEYSLQYVMQGLKPACLARDLAEQYLCGFRRPVIEVLEQDGGKTARGGRRDPHAPIDYQKWRGQLDTAKEALKSYGDISMDSLITPDEQYRTARLHVDSTLVALNILKEQRANGFVEASYRPGTVFDWRHDGARIRIKHLAGELAWAVETDKADQSRSKHLLRIKHLMLISPTDFQGSEKTARLIVANVIKNTRPEMLQASLSPEWLSMCDTAALFSHWTPAELSCYLKRHATHINTLPRFRILSIAKGLVACGSVADLELCVAHGRILFEPPLADAHAPAFFQIALLRGDPLMLAALVKRLEEGMAISNRIKQQLAVILAAADEQGVPALFEVFCRRKPNALLPLYYNMVVRAAIDKLITPEQLANILAAKNTRQTPALTILMKNNDGEKIKDYGVLLMNAHTHGVLERDRFTTLLAATTAGRIPAILLAVDNECADAIMAFGGIIVAAHENRIHDPAHAFALLAAEVLNGWSSLRYAADTGKTAAAIAIGKVMRVAVRKKALNNEHVYMLLRGPATAKHLVLETALLANASETATAIGEQLLNFYKDDVIDGEQICQLLSGATKESTQYMINVLPLQGRDAAINALGNFIMIADAIRRAKDGPTPPPLSAPDACKVILPASLAKECSTEGLAALASMVNALRGKLQSGQLSNPQILIEACILELHMQRSRMALFFNSEDVRARINIFDEIRREWEALNDLL